MVVERLKCPLRRHSGRHRLRILQAAGAAGARGRGRQSRGRRPGESLLRAERTARQAGARRGDSRPAICAACPRCSQRSPTDARTQKAKSGLASLLKTLWGAEYEDERDSRFINDRVHANIQRDGTFSVIPRIYGGVTSPDQLRRIADVADKHDVKMVKITGGQRIDLLGIRKEKLPEVWRDLGMPSGHAYAKVFSHLQDLCRHGLLPLRSR